MTVPDKAVEAAARALPDALPSPWDPEWNEKVARAALEAAAPFIAAEALREAAEDDFYDGDADRPMVGYGRMQARADRIERGAS